MRSMALAGGLTALIRTAAHFTPRFSGDASRRQVTATITSLATIAMMLLSGCHSARHSRERVERQVIETTPLDVLDLSTFNGPIEVIANDVASVELEIHFKAFGPSPEQAQANLEALRCQVEADEGTLLIKAVKPNNQWMGSAAFLVKAPRQCRLKLKTSNGKIFVRQFDADVDLQTSNGAIEVADIGGSIQARTSNGAIRAANISGSLQLETSNGRIEYAGPLNGQENRIATSNGRIELKLPADQSLELSAKTSNGSIQCNLPTQQVLNQSKRYLAAIIGPSPESDCKLEISTSNGAIRIDPLDLNASPTHPPEDGLEARNR